MITTTVTYLILFILFIPVAAVADRHGAQAATRWLARRAAKKQEKS